MYIPFGNCVQLCGGQPFKGVIHIGAHHGEEANDYKAFGVERVAWFEACRDFMDILYRNTQQIGGMEQQYFNECLSDQDDVSVEFNVANNGQSSSMLKLGTHATMYPHITFDKSIKMITKRFDTIQKKQSDIIPFDKFDFINLDVQGAELKVLKGFGPLLAKPSIRAVYTEVNFEEVYEDCCLIEELDEFLGSFGFKRVCTAAPEKTWGDSIYMREEV